MGGVQSANVDRPNPPNPPTACENNIPLIQQELLKADEFKERYYVKLNTIERIDISGSLTRCKAGLFLTNITSGVTSQETRIISLLEENGQTIVKSIVADSSETAATDVKPYYTSAQVEKYYNDLHSYNNSWTAFRWKTEDTYAPPMPQWRDPIFEKNVEIYNQLFRSILGKGTSNPVNIQAIETASGSVPGSTVANNYYQKYLSPLPADPAPPSPRLLTVPQMIQPTATAGGSASLPPVNKDATVSNMQAQAKNMDSYNAYLGPGSPDYDPPQPGDNYETVLIKYNKSYDIATSRNVTASNMDNAGSAVPSTNRRLINRINNSVPEYRVPDPILPTTGIQKAARYKSYNFNERQQYIIDYSPVTGPNRDLLVKNFCNSLGYEAYSDKLPGCEPGDCCAPMPAAPVYDKEAAAVARAAARAASASKTEGFTASASGAAANNSKCTGGISLAGRTITVSVPRPPVTLNPSQAMFAYRTTRPTDPAPSCAGRITDPNIDVDSIKELYNQLRPSLIKELQQSLKGNKMFELRCPADLT